MRSNVIEVNPGGEGPLATVRVALQGSGTRIIASMSGRLPYAGNASGAGTTGSALKLAASGHAFSEWLVSSPYAGEVTPDRLLSYLGGVPEVYGADAGQRTGM